MIREDLFMITCAARTGSTLLTSYLQSHPEVLCHGEIYSPIRVNGILGIYGQKMKENSEYAQKLKEYRDQKPQAFLYKVAFDQQQRKVVGFKLKHDELILPSLAETRYLIHSDLDIKIIHLRRENLLLRYLSWYIVNHVTGVTMRIEGEELPKVEQVSLEPYKCLENFKDAERRYNFFQSMFSSHPIYEVSYEELTDSTTRDQKLREIQSFLNVERFELKTKMVKLSQQKPEEVIKNYDELRNFFRETKYSIFFN